MTLASLYVYTPMIASADSAGTGVIEITSLSQITNLAGSYKLTQPVTIDASSWTPISSFTGVFDGDGQTITWSGEKSLTSSNYGIFANSSGTVKNLNVAGSFAVSGSNYDYVSAVVGYNSGIIDSVTSSATVTAVECYNVGGIAGFNDVGVIKNSKNSGNVSGKSKTGGIVGENAGLVSSCSNTGSVRSYGGSKDGTGGIVGRNGNNNTAVETGTVRNCYNEGKITDESATGTTGRWIGGIAGFQNSLSTITNAYSVGEIAGYRNYNNIVGQNEGHSYNCYGSRTNGTGTDVQEVGLQPVAEGADATTANIESYMKTYDTSENGIKFVSQLKGSSNNIWTQNNGELPKLLYDASETSATSAGGSNDESVIFLSNTGNDSAETVGTSETPAATLAKAVELADQSTKENVYIKVLNTITVSASDERVFGSSTQIVWAGRTDIENVMFDVTGSLVIGGLRIKGNDVTTMFAVENGGSLAVRNNANLSGAATAIDVKAGGTLTLNKSSLAGGSYAVKLADSTSACTMSVGSNQQIALGGKVYLGTGATMTMAANPATMLVSPITVESSSLVTNTVIATASGVEFNNADKDMFSLSTASSATLAFSASQIYIAS